MRNLLDKSRVAQNLDGRGRLPGSLRFPRKFNVTPTSCKRQDIQGRPELARRIGKPKVNPARNSFTGWRFVSA